jgi:hypothetical protein
MNEFHKFHNVPRMLVVGVGRAYVVAVEAVCGIMSV